MALTSPNPLLNLLAAELALELEAVESELVLGEHLRGVLNAEADSLSRLSEGKELPVRLRCVRRSRAADRRHGFYRLRWPE